MTVDLTVELENKPGRLADLGEALGNAGVNVDGVCGFPCKGRGEIHILVDDSRAVKKALKASGISVTGEREVLLVGVENKPGELGKIARSIADTGVNIELVYLNMKDELVIGADDLGKARAGIEAAGGEVELM